MKHFREEENRKKHHKSSFPFDLGETFNKKKNST